MEERSTINDAWSMETFCAIQRQAVADTTTYPENTQVFFRKLGLPFLHPFCVTNNTEVWSPLEVPPMGPAEIDYDNLHGGSQWEKFVTICHMFMPQLLSFCALWFLVFSTVLAPLGCLFLMKYTQQDRTLTTRTGSSTSEPRSPSKLSTSSAGSLSLACVVTTLSSFVIMTDALYIHDFGPLVGIILFLLSSVLSLRVCMRYRLRVAAGTITCLWILAVSLRIAKQKHPSFPFGLHDLVEKANFEEGLYHNDQNHFVSRIVALWSPSTRIYSTENQATRWMKSGDMRTGLPFFLNKIDYDPCWIRVWLHTTTSPDNEVLALDISFPTTGHNFTQPVYMVFHGLNGGSNDGFVKDLAMRRNRQGSTVVVMVARGMMDTPISTWNFFHGARLSDANDAALAIRKAVGQDQVFIGVGYSMGAIVLNNYVATTGVACPLDAAFSISGALDCRYELNDTRSKLLWQPLLADSMKSRFLLKKHGKKVKERLSNYEMIQLMRASSVVDVDRWAAVAYHKFGTLEEYYEEMSAMGDIPQEAYYNRNTSAVPGKIHNISIPLCILHALDDPISTWRTVAANEGMMHPQSLVQSGRGNLMMLLTKKGGHVGWPLGWLSQLRQWEFMNEAAAAFASAVVEAKQECSI